MNLLFTKAIFIALAGRASNPASSERTMKTTIQDEVVGRDGEVKEIWIEVLVRQHDTSFGHAFGTERQSEVELEVEDWDARTMTRNEAQDYVDRNADKILRKAQREDRRAGCGVEKEVEL